MFTLLLIK